MTTMRSASCDRTTATPTASSRCSPQDLGKLSAIARGARSSQATLCRRARALRRDPGRARRPAAASCDASSAAEHAAGLRRDPGRPRTHGGGGARRSPLLRDAHAAAGARRGAVRGGRAVPDAGRSRAGDPHARGALGVRDARALSDWASRHASTRAGARASRCPTGGPAYFDPALGAVVSRRFGGGPFLLSARASRERLMRRAGRALAPVARRSWERRALALARAAVAAFVACTRSRSMSAHGLFPA